MKFVSVVDRSVDVMAETLSISACVVLGRSFFSSKLAIFSFQVSLCLAF